MCHLWHSVVMMHLNCRLDIFSLARIRVDLSQAEVAAQLCMCPDIAVGREILGMQSESIEEPPVGAIFFGKKAVGHGNEHPGRQEPPIENLEELALRVPQGKGSCSQVFDVALQHEGAVSVAVEGLGELGGNIQTGGMLTVQDNLVARKRHIVTDKNTDSGVHF